MDVKIPLVLQESEDQETSTITASTMTTTTKIIMRMRAPGSWVPRRRCRPVVCNQRQPCLSGLHVDESRKMFKLPASSRSMVSLEVDDLWRIIEMTLLLGVIVPISGK